MAYIKNWIFLRVVVLKELFIAASFSILVLSFLVVENFPMERGKKCQKSWINFISCWAFLDVSFSCVSDTCAKFSFSFNLSWKMLDTIWNRSPRLNGLGEGKDDKVWVRGWMKTFNYFADYAKIHFNMIYKKTLDALYRLE